LRTRFAVYVLLIALAALPARAATLTPPLVYSQEAEAAFQRALARYIQSHYADARLGFQSLVSEYPPNQRTSAARLMLAKSHYKLKEYSLSIAAAVELYEYFPFSRYLPDADLAIGDCYYHQGQVYSAATQYARVVSGKGDLRLKSRAADRLGQMAGSNRLTDRDVERLKLDFGRAIVAEAVGFGEARWPHRLGDAKEGKRRMAVFLERYPNGIFADRVRRTLVPPSPPKATVAKPDTKKPGPSRSEPPPEPVDARYKVGVIGPLEAPMGKDLRDGIILARDLNPLASGESVGLIFGDSEGEPIRAIRAAQHLIDQSDVVAVIGGLTSRETIPLAALLSPQGVPLVAPTASEDGIATLPGVFQMNATPGAQGRRIADYAVRKLGLRTLGTLTTRDAYGDRITKEFTARAEELGAEVVVQEWYEHGTTDFKLQFERIREAGLALKIPDSFAEEVESLLLSGIEVGYPEPEEVDPDTVQQEPVTTLDGLFIAGYADDILLIAPQVAFHQIQAQLLGSDGWSLPEVSRDGGSYVDGAIFVTKYYDQSENPSVREFVDAFRRRFGRDQTIAAALGYDAMLAVLRAINAGGGSRSQLRERLSTISGISGATGQIAFRKGDRENAWMYLLTIRRGQIRQLALDEGSPEALPP